MKGIDTYQETSVTTQSKGRLIVMLYEGTVKFLKLAIRENEAGNHEGRGKYINKAVDILFELNTVLDMDAGGEVAMNLRRLYMFMIRHLHAAHVKEDSQKIQEVINLVEELNQGWKAIAD